MIDRQTFLRYWDPKMSNRYSPSELETLRLEMEEHRFLLDVGLPGWAAPNIHFYESLRSGDSGLVQIGEDRDDRPILLRPANGTIVVGTQDTPPRLIYMNRSVAALLDTLALYAAMVDDALERAGEDAFTANNIPDSLILRFSEGLAGVDRAAVEPGTFWDREIARTRSHTPDQRKPR